MTATVSAPAAAGPAPMAHRPARLTDALTSEWTKIRTIPSTLWILLSTVVLGVGLSALFSAVAAHVYATGTQTGRLTWDPTSISTSGGEVAQLAIGVLGTLIITSEYATHAIRTTLAAVPRRGRLLTAKALVIAAIALTTGELTMFVSFFAGQALISGHAPTATLGQPHVLRAVIGCGLYVTLIALLGLGLGALLRSTAAAISFLVALLYIIPGLAAVLPDSLHHTVEKYWPTQAGQQITAVARAAHTLSPWTGFADLSLFAVVVLTIALVRFNRADA